MKASTPPAASDFMGVASSQLAFPAQHLVESSYYNSMVLSLTQQQWSAVATLSNKKIEELPEVDSVYLKRLRLKNGLSQQAFAEKLKIHVSTVARWEAEAGDVDEEGEGGREKGKEDEAIAPENKPLSLLDLIKRQGLNISEFAETVEKAWAPISGRSLTRTSVGRWISGRNLPHLHPKETRAILEILDCSLDELIVALETQEKEKEEKPLTLLDLIKRQGLNIGKFAEAVETAWQPISGRTLSRESVGRWINGHNLPHLQPKETSAILQILDCSLEELSQAIEISKSKKFSPTP